MTKTNDPLQVDVRPWSRRTKLVVYGLVPVATSLALIAAYFSGVPWLQRIVSPVLDGMPPDSWREFGLLENLQNLCLLAMIGVFALGCRRKRIGVERAAFACLVLVALFVLLEEIDYGTHFYDFVFRRPADLPIDPKPRNLHNRGETNKIIKNSVDIGMALLFFVFPLWRSRMRKPLLRYLTPDPYAILTLVAMLALKSLAHGLQDAGFGGTGTISKNISEFRELNTYYLFLVYAVDVVFSRTFGRGLVAVPPRVAPEEG